MLTPFTKILEKYRRKAFSDGRQKTLCSRSRSANKQSAKRAAAAGFSDYGRTSTSNLHLQPPPPTSTYNLHLPHSLRRVKSIQTLRSVASPCFR